MSQLMRSIRLVKVTKVANDYRAVEAAQEPFQNEEMTRKYSRYADGRKQKMRHEIKYSD